jgi:hypothetical protein
MDMPLEVFDGRSGRLLASSTLKALVVSRSRDGRNDKPVIAVWRVHVPDERARGDPR